MHARKSRTHTPPTDSELAATAANAIKWLTTIPQDTIQVSAHKGWLSLEGCVQWGHQRSTIENVTRPLPGVRGVTNAIRIEADPAFADVRAVA